MPQDSALRNPPADPRSRYESLNEWLRARRRYALIAIVVVAALLRIVCFAELTVSPCVALHQWDQGDMSTFHSWALTIAHGDGWSKTVRPPLHIWHRQIADDYARLFPQRWAELQAAAAPDEPHAAARALWNRWAGGGRAYQGPLYPYFVAGLYALLGRTPLWVYAVQMAVGIASLVLVHVLTRRYFDDVAATAAAALTLLYGPLLFYEFVLLRATLIVFGGLLLLLLLDRARERPTSSAWSSVGVLLGLLLALKAHFVLMLPAAGLLLVIWNWKQRPALSSCALSFVAGAIVGFSPVVVRNIAAGAPPLALAGNGPITFLVSNVRGTGAAGWTARHAAAILAETDGAFLPTVVAALRTHPTLGSYLRLLLEKTATVWYWHEAPSSAGFHYAELHSELLSALPVSFGFIGPPAVVGMVLALRRTRRCAPLYFLVLANLAVLLIFFAFSRFRLPLAAALTPFVGFAACRLLQFLLAARWKAAAAITAASALPMLFTLSPAAGDLPSVRTSDVQVGYQVYYDPLVRSALSRGDLRTAATILEESLRRQPPEIARLGPQRPARFPLTADLAAFYAEVHQHLADLLDAAGSPRQAQQQFLRAADLRQAAGIAPRPALPPQRRGG
jgi:4-amino-4-deoxy-L-arabinose transferase-like glycosyltransferase